MNISEDFLQSEHGLFPSDDLCFSGAGPGVTPTPKEFGGHQGLGGEGQAFQDCHIRNHAARGWG